MWAQTLCLHGVLQVSQWCLSAVHYGIVVPATPSGCSASAFGGRCEGMGRDVRGRFFGGSAGALCGVCMQPKGRLVKAFRERDRRAVMAGTALTGCLNGAYMVSQWPLVKKQLGTTRLKGPLRMNGDHGEGVSTDPPHRGCRLNLSKESPTSGEYTK